MSRFLSKLLDILSDFLSKRKGLLPALGLVLVAINLLLRIFFGSGLFVETDLFLHVGVILAIFGFMLAWAL